MTPKPNTTRYEKLCDYFEQTMQNPKISARIRMTAAQRLSELLERRDKREAVEARRQGREALRATRAEQQALQGKTETPSPTVDIDDIRMQRARELLENVTQKVRPKEANRFVHQNT